jgi:hypothetical protein
LSQQEQAPFLRHVRHGTGWQDAGKHHYCLDSERQPDILRWQPVPENQEGQGNKREAVPDQ